ncbi:MAG: methionine synthase [Candidatus Odinarchaeum yellowstonii]|uniref:Methionine synthase n=1 Tax=Odinarchaeota yellowstonii (strain LCB_4) TaxID=1841599 RepID=A0AAF0D2B6_ODILC|nr:MAG: methionine synthase [Candidatus Odinarchaeum yellowstonii]
MLKTLKPLLKTVIGSYPVNGLTGLEAVKNAVEKQLKAGVELVSDGQTRRDMISYFTDHIPGFLIQDKQAKIVDKINPPEKTPILEDLVYASSFLKEGCFLKAIITGPVTLVASAKIDKSSPYHGFLDQKLYVDLGEALKREAELLLKSGAAFLQIDEPFYSVGAPIELGKLAIKIITENVKVPVGLHVCGDIRKVFSRLVSIEGVDVLSLEFAASPSNFTVINKQDLEKYDKILGVGCVNSQSSIVESVSSIKEILVKASSILNSNNFIVHPDCGLRLLPGEVAYSKLVNMGVAVSELTLIS